MTITLKGRRIQMAVDSATGKLIPLPPPPEAPVISVTTLTSSSLRVTLDSAVNAESVVLEVSATGTDGWSTLTSNLTNTYDHTTLAAGETRYYRPTGVNAVGSTIGLVKSATTATEGSSLPGFTADTGFTLTELADGSLQLEDSSARFGEKPNGAKPLLLFDFSSGSDQPSSLGRRTPVVTWAAQCIPSTIIYRPGSTHSMILDTSDITAYNTPLHESQLDVSGNVGRKYFRHHVYYNNFTRTDWAANSSAPNMKWCRWQHKDAQTTPYTGNVMQGSTMRYAFTGDGGDVYSSLMYNTTELDTKRWRSEEEYHEISSATNATDAVMHGILDGKRTFTRTGVKSHKTYDPALYKWDYFKLASYAEWGETGDAPFHLDLLYLEDSWCRVWITESGTWDETVVTKKEIQIPATWGAGVLSFIKRLGEFTSLSGKHLWVVDNNDTKIHAGSWS